MQCVVIIEQTGFCFIKVFWSFGCRAISSIAFPLYSEKLPFPDFEKVISRRQFCIGVIHFLIIYRDASLPDKPHGFTRARRQA